MNRLLTFNIFKPSNNDTRHQHNANTIATYVYLLTLILISINLGLYSWTSLQTTIVTLEQPKKEEFELLPIDAQCPCSRIALSYGEYSSLQAEFHQVCSSDFVTNRWIKALDYGFRVSSVYSNDFRGVGNAQFDGLAALCSLSEANVFQNLESFALNTLISPYVLSEKIFQTKIQAIINQFQSTLPNQFQTQLQLLLDMTFNNRLDSGLGTNFRMTYYASRSNPLAFGSERYKPVSGPVCNLEKPTLGSILTRIISILSGLTLVLGFLIPKIIHYIEIPRDNLQQVQITSVNHRWIQMKLLMKNTLIELNFFENQMETNNRQIRYQRYASRLYMFFVILALLIFANYTLLRKNIHRETIFNPTESDFLKLHGLYSTSLSCPCTSISIPYSTFLYTIPSYHQICSSDFTSSQWMDYVAILDENTNYYSLDYRLHAGSYFQSLGTFCYQAKKTIDTALNIYLQTQFVGSQVLSQQLFESQMNSSIQNWQSATINQFLRTIQLLRATTQGNQLLHHALNADFYTNRTTRQTSMTSRVYSNCSCTLSSSCLIDLSIYDNQFQIRYYIPNFFIGCFVIESLLQSTLQCFYDRSCMFGIDQYLALPLEDSFNFSPLNSTLNSPNQTIDYIVNHLMVDSWSSNISFTSYYSSCSPKLCTYEEERQDTLFILITAIIGVLGGLSLGFKILILLLLKLVDNLIHGFSRRMFIEFLQKMFTCRDKHRVTEQLRFVLIATILYALYINVAFAPRIETVQIDKPSLIMYEDLIKTYPNTLQCSCSKLSIEYQKFLTITPRFHHVCASDFVSENFITYLFNQASQNHQLTPFDFQYSSTLQFRLLALFCQLSQETVNDTLLQLSNTVFINTYLLSANLLNIRIQTTIHDFETTIPQLFLSTLALIRETTGANRLMTALGTSWKIAIPYVILDFKTATIEPMIYQGCSCAVSPKCVQPSDGMLAGCYPLEALFQSTFSCLYNQQCIDIKGNYRPMNISSIKTSRFVMNTTIESIVNQLMVEEYLTNISYENYFYECAPQVCTYSYTKTINIFDGTTYLISLYGGLVILCRIMVKIIIKLLWSQTNTINSI
ncbi:hypothetical protein I4U23_023359 [Adineta vaga]|nr:hypothetical protein I4U23_023359 [Adineta vaga]